MSVETICEIEEQVGFNKKPKNIFDKVLIFVCSSFMFFGSMFLAIIISAAAFVRYVLGGDLYGFEEIVKLIAFWVYFMGAAYGSFNNTHVSADLVSSYVPEGIAKRILFFARDLVTFAVCGLFTWYGYTFFMFGYMGPLGTGIAIPTTTVWRIPLWTSYLSIFFGLICMSIYFFRNLFQSTAALFRGNAQ